VLDGWRMQLIEARLTALSAVQAGCERIRNTPIPFAYRLLLHRTAALFCLMLPFGLAHAFGYAAPVFVMVISYAFFGLDALGDELEDPFGREANDLPIDLMAAGIEREVRAWLAVKG
jgi:putative membrane protein